MAVVVSNQMIQKVLLCVTLKRASFRKDPYWSTTWPLICAL